MQTVNASVILEDAERLLGWDLDQLETRQKQIARTALSLALQEVWESWWWSHLMQCEAVPGAPVYDRATAYAADEFVYFPGTQKYYQCLATSTGNAPATYADGAWTTNYEYWAETKSLYSGDDFVVGTTYDLGDIVRNPVDGQFYQRTGNDYLASGWSAITFEGTTFIRQPVGTTTRVAVIPPDGSSWINSVGSVYYNVPDLASPIAQKLAYNAAAGLWILSGQNQNLIGGTCSTVFGQYSDEYNFYPAVTPGEMVATPATLGPSDDSLNWALLIPFVPTCGIHGPVRAVGDLDPRNRACLLYNFDETAEGVRIPDLTTGVPWIWYRRATPILTGDDYSATATYTAAETLTYD